MRYLSLCSGIEAASKAWHDLGFEPAAFAEIDPFCSDVLEHYFPDVPNLGDLTKITADDVAALGPIDIVVGGTPCQDLSVAGRRAGIEGENSRLFFDFLRVWDAARSLSGARWLVWENTPGALSNNEGRDFARVVNEIAGSELAVPESGWQTEGLVLGDAGLVEYAVLDAQWFGVPQRRRRVFVILDTGNWFDRSPVLLEPESVRGDPPTRERARPGTTGAITARSRKGRGASVEDAASGLLVPDVANTLTHRMSKGINTTLDEGQTPIVECDDVAAPIVTGEGRTYTNEGKTGVKTRNVVACFDETQITHPENRSTADPDTANLSASARPPSVALEGAELRVRRLMPIECERLQGFPDLWTAIEYRGKTASDTARYRALGNSMAVPVMRWIGEQIRRAHAGE